MRFIASILLINTRQEVVCEIYSQYFTNKYPARSCVEVSRLPKDVQIEIEAIAYYE